MNTQVQPGPTPAGKVQAMYIGEAIQNLKIGKRVARRGWNGKYLTFVQVRDPVDMPPYVAICEGPARYMRWSPIQADVLADDWTVVE